MNFKLGKFEAEVDPVVLIILVALVCQMFVRIFGAP
jgi:hypothetical protein